MKIYTKTGDKGQTGLYSGKRLSKAHPRVEAYGTVDELNSFVGLLRDYLEDEVLRQQLFDQQQHLFALGAAMADDRPGEAYQLPANASTDLEGYMDSMNEELPKMTHFILPGGHPAVSHTHVCRTVCRRAERRTVELADTVEMDPSIVIFLNRLSDYFFVLGRFVALKLEVEEVKWIS
jgi:cob(I)alamin adenosyltransferase